MIRLHPKCAKCDADYSGCQECPVHKGMNRVCDFCGGEHTKGKLKPFLRSTSRGIREYMACKSCIAKLT